MNTAISLIIVHHVLSLLKRKIQLSTWARFGIYLGVLLPLGDDFLRIFLGEVWYRVHGAVFRSLVVEGIVWSCAAMLYWAYRRDSVRSLRWLSPLLGLSVYAIVTFLTFEESGFFYPLSDRVFHLGWMITGYPLPLLIAVLLLTLRRWSEVSYATISKMTLGLSVLIIVFTAAARFNIAGQFHQSLTSERLVSLIPADILQTVWYVVTMENQQYRVAQHHFIQGKKADFAKVKAFNDLEMAQSVLLNPDLYRLYFDTFKNPVMTVEVANDVTKVRIDELLPRRDLFWVKTIWIHINRSGQVIDSRTAYGFVFHFGTENSFSF
jgi:hypothetical protein